MPQTRVDIIPAQAEKLLSWANHLLSALKPGMGIDQEEMDELGVQLAEFDETISQALEAQQLARGTTARKAAARRSLDNRLRGLIRRIKAQADYSTATGMLLGIEASLKVMSGEPPQISAVDKTGGVVEVRFSKYGSDGVNIYCQREGDSGWCLLAHAPASPYVDQRPLLAPDRAELRRYSAVYVKRRREVGQFSGEVVLACAP